MFVFCRKPSTTQSTICLDKSGGWSRGGSVILVYWVTCFRLCLFCLDLGFHSSACRNAGLIWITFLQETSISNAWYEVLSVLHLMATLSLSQANLLLLPRTSADGHQPKVSEGKCWLQIFMLVMVYLSLHFHHH